MDPEERRQESFFEHLTDSEKRLGAGRHSLFDGLFVGGIVVVILAGFALGFMRLWTSGRFDQAATIDAARPVTTPTTAPRPDEKVESARPVTRPEPVRPPIAKEPKVAAPPAPTPT